MNLCSDGHTEVCYGNNDCPCCELIKEKDDIEDDLDNAEKKITELEEKLADLENEDHPDSQEN